VHRLLKASGMVCPCDKKERELRKASGMGPYGKKERELRLDMDRVLGPEFLATTKYMGPVRDKPSSTVMWYFLKLFQSLASRWDVAFDRYTAATDLRAPPRVLSRQPTTVWSWTASARDGLLFCLSIPLAQLMEKFDGRVVAAATEARARLWSLARGVAKKAVVAELAAAVRETFAGEDCFQELRRLLTDEEAERGARAQLVGALAVVELDARLFRDDDDDDDDGDPRRRGEAEDSKVDEDERNDDDDDAWYFCLERDAACRGGKKRRTLLTMCEAVRLPYLENTSVGTLGISREEWPLDAPGDLMSRQYARWSMCLLIIAELERRMPPVDALIANFTNVCAAAAQCRRAP